MRRGRLALAAAAGLSCALWTVYGRWTFSGWAGDAVWYLEPARNVLRGWGAVSRLFSPAQVSWLPAPARLPAPLLLHPPLSTWLLAGAFKLFGLSAGAAVGYWAVLLLLAGLLAYSTARELAGARAGVLAALAFWANYDVFSGFFGSLTDAPFLLAVTAAWWCLWRSDSSRRSAAWAAAEGLALAAACWCRLAGQSYFAGFFLAALYLHARARPRSVAAFAGGLAAGLAPLSLYYRATLGIGFYSPGYYALCWSPSFPGFRSSTTFMRLTSFQALLRYPLDFLQKAVTGPLYAASHVFQQSASPVWLALCLLALCAGSRDKREERFRRFAVLVALPVLAFNAVFSYGGLHYNVPLLPLAGVVGAAFFWRFADERAWWSAPWRRALVVAVGLYFLLGGTAVAVKDEIKARPERLAKYDDFQRLAQFVRDNSAPGDVIYSDSPQELVWQADTTGVELPATLDDARQAFAKLPPDDLVFTTNWISNPDYDPAFQAAFQADAPILGFTPCARWKGRLLEAAVYRRAGACLKR